MLQPQQEAEHADEAMEDVKQLPRVDLQLPQLRGKELVIQLHLQSDLTGYVLLLPRRQQ